MIFNPLLYLPCCSKSSTATASCALCVSLYEWFSKCGPRTRSSSNVTGKLVWSAYFWAIFHAYWITNWGWGPAICMLISPPLILMRAEVCTFQTTWSSSGLPCFLLLLCFRPIWNPFSLLYQLALISPWRLSLGISFISSLSPILLPGWLRELSSSPWYPEHPSFIAHFTLYW